MANKALSRIQLSLKRRQIVDAQKWAWFDYIGWEPHRKQIPCHASLARNRYTCAGRRGGKTAWAAKEAGAYMIAGPYRIWLVGPRYDDVNMEFRAILEDLEHEANPHDFTVKVHNPSGGNMRICLSNGSECLGRSTAQSGKFQIVGEEVDLLILCEGARIQGLGGEGGVWETQLEGNLSTRLGDLIVPTTPAGKDNFLYPRFMKALSGVDKNEFALQWPSWENPTFLEDPVALMSRLSPRAFSQEYLGEFVSWTGSIWIEDCGFSERHVVNPLSSIPSWWKRTEVIDPGWSDYCFWIAAVTDDFGVTYIVDEFHDKQRTFDSMAKMILRRRREFYGGEDHVPSVIPVYVDPEDPQYRTELSKAALEQGGRISTLQADNNVILGFESGSRMFRTDSLFITTDCPISTEALRYHEWGDLFNSKGGRIEKRDEYKHASDCIRYLCISNILPASRPKEEKIIEGVPVSSLFSTAYPDGVFGGSFDKFKELHGGRGL